MCANKVARQSLRAQRLERVNMSVAEAPERLELELRAHRTRRPRSREREPST